MEVIQAAAIHSLHDIVSLLLRLLEQLLRLPVCSQAGGIMKISLQSPYVDLLENKTVSEARQINTVSSRTMLGTERVKRSPL